MYFKDLTPYTYFDHDREARNVGWLDVSKNYTKGEVSKEFLEALQIYYTYPIFVARGFHVCNLCPKEHSHEKPVIQYGEIKREVGYYELRVLGTNHTIYAAPSMIYHYITEHHYLPPQEFIDAVLSFDSEVYLKFIHEKYAASEFWWEKDRTRIK